MKERPILFSGEMVRAILDGLKTQTRRVVKPQPEEYRPGVCSTPRCVSIPVGSLSDYLCRRIDGMIDRDVVPFAEVGDRLWVRETWAGVDGSCRVAYRADGKCVGRGGDGRGGWMSIHHGWLAGHGPSDKRGDTFGLKRYGDRWRPSIHMPRWASRITLEVTEVRVERLQDISEADASAEGVTRLTLSSGTIDNIPLPFNKVHPMTSSYRDAFRVLWDQLNAKRGYSWESNSWVWVVTFRRVEQ